MPGGIRRWRALPASTLIAAWLAAPQGALAQPAAAAGQPAAVARPDPVVESRRQFMAGERLFRAGRYREAARAYQRGYRLSHRPGFLINIAHCQVRLGRLDLAREQYRRFLAEAPDAPHAVRVAQALADIDAQLAPAEVATPAPAQAAEPGTTPVGMPEPPPLPLGPRDLLHQPSPAEQALRQRAPAPAPGNRRWLWPAVGVAAAVVAGTVAVFAARDQRPAAQSRGSIGTIRR